METASTARDPIGEMLPCSLAIKQKNLTARIVEQQGSLLTTLLFATNDIIKKILLF